MKQIKKIKLVVMISGEGTNLQALINAQKERKISTQIMAVITDNKDAYGIKRAKKNNIPTFFFDQRNFDTKDEFYLNIVREIKKLNPDLIVLAGFMKILNKDFINAFPYKILNIHPSILPKFKGLNTHKRVLESGVKYHGATVHFVEENLDSGPIIMQYKLAVNKNDDEETLRNRVHKGEYLILVETIKLFIMKDLKIDNNSIIIDGVPLHNPILYEESI